MCTRNAHQQSQHQGGRNSRKFKTGSAWAAQQVPRQPELHGSPLELRQKNTTPRRLLDDGWNFLPFRPGESQIHADLASDEGGRSLNRHQQREPSPGDAMGMSRQGGSGRGVGNPSAGTYIHGAEMQRGLRPARVLFRCRPWVFLGRAFLPSPGLSSACASSLSLWLTSGFQLGAFFDPLDRSAQALSIFWCRSRENFFFFRLVCLFCFFFLSEMKFLLWFSYSSV